MVLFDHLLPGYTRKLPVIRSLWLCAQDTETHFIGTVRSKRRVKAECNMNRVGANPEKLCQLHMRNTVHYLRYKSAVEADGECQSLVPCLWTFLHFHILMHLSLWLC